MKIEKLLPLLEKNEDVLYTECLEDLKSKNVQVKVYSKPFDKDRQLVTLGKRVKSMDFDRNKIIGIPKLIRSLETYRDEKVSIIKIANEKRVYTLIMNVQYDGLIGLFVNKGMNINKLSSIQNECSQRGYPKNDQWYSPQFNTG